MKKNVNYIYPSLLASDLLNLSSTLKNLEDLGIESIHCDVMDGHFVPEISFGAKLISDIKKTSKLKLDVHIMVENPDMTFKHYTKAGADTLTFHIECSKQPYKLCQEIKKEGVKAGLSLNPGTPISSLDSLLQVVDQITIMTVNPGYSFQDHIDAMWQKITELVSLRKQNKGSFKILVDGGVNSKNIKKLMSLGADAVVAGGALFKEGSLGENLKALISHLEI